MNFSNFAQQRSGMICFGFIVTLFAMFALGCSDSTNSAGSSPGNSNPTPMLAAGIHPLTQVNVSANTGYFSDPLPIHRAMADGSYVPSLSGTRAQIIACSTFAVGCYTPSALTITMSASLTGQLPAGASLKGYENYNVYQDNAGNWQMALTRAVSNPVANPTNAEWNVILHASPASGSATDPSGVPLTWVQDTLLVGSFTTRVGANYDGKYIEDNGKLYLIYSKNLVASPTNGQDGIVAQPMISATQPTTDTPTILLPPETNSDGGYNSELLQCQNAADQFKLIETGNITVLAGKYVMAYSTGSYDTTCYKAGIAWSDSLLGPYKKVLQADPNNVWQNPSPEPEVLYLLQALQPAWPNYIKTTVQAPGVPSLVQYPAGTWYLYFAGYDPSVPLNAGLYDPQLRQPYVMRLNVNVPTGATVAGSSNQALSTWVTAATQ